MDFLKSLIWGLIFMLVSDFMFGNLILDIGKVLKEFSFCS